MARQETSGSEVVVTERESNDRPIVMLRMPDVERKVGMKRATIYAHMKKDTFPKCVKIGGNSAWVEYELDDFLRERMLVRDALSRCLNLGYEKRTRRPK